SGGVEGFYLVLGEGLSEEANRRAQALARALLEAPPEGLWDAIPAYGTLYLEYDSRRLSGARLLRFLRRLASFSPEEEGKYVVI
ncbi:carboxyltransferase domain-containing protein, partial [Acinetobacter baumannii]